MNFMLAGAAMLITGAMGAAEAQRWIHPKCRPARCTMPGPFVTLDDGSLLTLDEYGTRVSCDNGVTWSEIRPMFDTNEARLHWNRFALKKTRSGAIVVAYLDTTTLVWQWDEENGKATDDSRSDVWAIRSLDDGKTWVDHQKILDGYSGNLMNMIQTSTGEVVVPAQDLSPDRERHVQYTMVSADEGQSWVRSNMIDLGGQGDHDGAFEATVEELTDGRLLMLVRTTLDRFWEAYSDDKGRSWRRFGPSDIDASSAPGYLLRLQSGQLALAWNRVCREGETEVPEEDRWSGITSRRPASWRRDELSIAFSEDDAMTWTEPVVIIRCPGGWVSYPYIHEAAPGTLWIGNRMGTDPLIGVELEESDFVGK